jgi:hypothetical protein
MGQYRHRFLHHCVDGPLLLSLTERQLKSELLVGPLGHRAILVEGIVGLAAAAAAASQEGGAECEGVYEDHGGGSGGEDEAWGGREVAAWSGAHGGRSRSPSPGRAGRQQEGGPRRPASAHTPVSARPPASSLGSCRCCCCPCCTIAARPGAQQSQCNEPGRCTCWL